MLSKIKRSLKKFRIFKRLREYKTEINRLRDVLIVRNRDIIKIKKEFFVNIKEVLKSRENFRQISIRRDEFLRRLQSKIPDDIMSESFENYKYWLSEPFIIEKYKSYIEPKDKDVYIDRLSAIRGIDKVLDKAEDLRGKDVEQKR